jgi:hypothetical protein
MSELTPPQAPYVAQPNQDHTADRLLRVALILASLGAAALLFGVATAHIEENTAYGVFLMAAGWFGIGTAAAFGSKGASRAWLKVALAGNVVIVAGTVLFRITGAGGGADPIGWADDVALGLQAAVAVGSIVGLTAPLSTRIVRPTTSGAFIGASIAAVIALVTVSMLPAGQGGPGTTTGGSTDVAAAPVAAHDAGAHDATGAHDAGAHDAAGTTAATDPVPYDPTKPINLSGTPGVTPAEQKRAEDLIKVTIKDLPQWSDPAVAEAKGFRSIGDGRTGVEHYVNQQYMDDDTILDPNKPESLVYDTTVTPKKLAAAMYMAKPGTTLDDVPDIGGPLTQWHVHTNLCYNAQGKVAGITNASGECPAGLVKPAAIPMIHVWIVPQRCGPFAALEGIGGGDIKPGETRLCDQMHGMHG